MATFGRDTPYGTAENLNCADFAYGFIRTAPENGTLTKLSVYGALSSGTGTAKMALFSVSGGVPQNRLAISSAVSMDTTLQNWDFPMTYTLVAGTQYAFVIGELSTAVQIVNTYQSGLGITLHYCSGATIPSTWTESGSWDADHPLSGTYNLPTLNVGSMLTMFQ